MHSIILRHTWYLYATLGVYFELPECSVPCQKLAFNM